MLKQELKKIFIKRYYAVILLALLAAEIILCVVQSNKEGLSGFNKEAYARFVETYAGEITAEKEKLLETSFLYLDNADDLRMLGEQFYQSGDITSEELAQLQAELQQYMSGRTGLGVFREHYAYASAKPGREIINNEAWREIFANDTADLIIVLAIIVFTVSAFVAENETNFTLLRLTTPKGRKALYRADLAIGMFSSALFSVLCSALRLGVGQIKWDLHDFGAPLESLEVFENTPFAGTLLGGYLTAALLKALGAAVFVAICFILGNLFTSSVTVLLAGLLSVLLPQYVLRDARIYYVSPVSLLRGMGFLYGNVILEEASELPFTVSEAAGAMALPVSLLIAALIVLCAFLFCKKRGAVK